jgi:hypothetical protein
MDKTDRTHHTARFQFTAVVTFLFPAPCWAATGQMPWDQTLLALQDLLIGSVAPAAIVLIFVSAGILYTLGGHDRQAGRLVGSGIGGGIALVVVHLLNYVLEPWTRGRSSPRSFTAKAQP